MAKIICGANVLEGNYEGMSVKQLQKILGGVLNISPEAKVLIGGKEVNEKYKLTSDDVLEFVKASGTKG